MTQEQKKPTEKTDEKPMEETQVEPTEETEVKPTVEPEDFEQKYKSLKGMYDKALKEHTALKEQQVNLIELSTKVDSIMSLVQSQGDQIGLLTDTLPEVVGASEELQERVKKSQEARLKQVEWTQKAAAARTEILDMFKVAKIEPEGEEAKPALEVYLKGEFPKAITLARQIVSSKIEKLMAGEKEKAKEEKTEEKPKQKVLTKSPVGQEGWRDLPSREKIKLGQAEAKK